MSTNFAVEIYCDFVEFLTGTIEDHTVGAVDRFFKNSHVFESTSDSPAVAAALSKLENQAVAYADGHIEGHVPALKKFRDGTATLDKPCALVNTWRALSKLDDAMDQLAADRDDGRFDAAHRVEALEAAGDAIEALGTVMQSVTVLQGFGEFLNAFVQTAWNPLTNALGLKFRQWEWLDVGYVEGNGYAGAQPT